ncbi:MAG TPA: FHA domain-containing protein [Polyangiaceae bacterium]
MTRVTPRATPVAPAPVRNLVPVAMDPAVSYLLRAPIVVVAPIGERELHAGVLTLGRLPSSDIALEDPLVSRVHARIITLEDGVVAVEDLHSTNGVFVNGVRLARGVRQLRDGDRLLIGTTELSLFALRTRSPAGRSLRPAETANTASLGPESADVPATERADALEVIGKLATRLANGGNVAEATRVLSTHLNKVLLGASAGLSVPATVLERATRFALDLLRWTRNAAWLDYVLELHLAILAVPSEQTWQALEPILKNASLEYDRKLFGHFVQKLATRRGQLSEQDARRLQQMESLLG